MAEHNFEIVTPGDAIEVIFETFMAEETRRHRPMMLGRPGVGKSTLMRTVASRMAIALGCRVVVIDLRLNNMEIGQLRGLERTFQGADGNVITVAARPDFMPEYVAPEDITPETVRYIILLDEIMAADDMIRKSAFELLTDHRVGPHELGDNVYVAAAGNSADDGSIVYEMDTATRDRFLPMLVESSAEGLAAHATANKWHPAVIGFIKNHTDMLVPSEEDVTNNNFSTPSSRSFERVSEAMYAYDAGKFGKLTLKVHVNGWLGAAAGAALFEDLDDEKSRYDLEKLLKDPANRDNYPSTFFGIYSLIGALVAYGDTEERLDKALGVVMSIPDDIADIVEECQASFFYSVFDRMRKMRLFQKWGQDPRVIPFLDKTEKIAKDADEEFARRQAASERHAANSDGFASELQAA